MAGGEGRGRRPLPACGADEDPWRPEDNEFKPPGGSRHVKVASLGPVLLAAAMAGCTLGGETANPNLLVPKLLLDAQPGAPNATVYVHSAFGDHAYDWMSLDVDNVTIANRTDVFSLEEQVPATGFFLTVRAGASGQVYEMKGRIDLDGDRQKARVAFLEDATDWNAPRTFNLPFERLLDRVTVEGSS
jgi:hypothetical protein